MQWQVRHIALFADGIISFSDLSNSIPALLDVTETSGSFSGYKVNIAKSSLMLLNEKERYSPMDYISTINSTDNFTYIALHIDPDVGKIAQTSYDPALAAI